MRSGRQRLETARVTDRVVHYKFDSGVVQGVKEVGFSPTMVFVIPFGLASDAVEFVATAATQFPASLIAGIDPSDVQSIATIVPSPQVAAHEKVLVRFGPRQLASVESGAQGEVSINARRAARAALAKGSAEMTVAIRLTNEDPQAIVVIGHDDLWALAGGAR